MSSNYLNGILLLMDEMEPIDDKNSKLHLDFGSTLSDLVVNKEKVIGSKNAFVIWSDIAKLHLVRRLLLLAGMSQDVHKLIDGKLFILNKNASGRDNELSTLVVCSYEEILTYYEEMVH